jgi:hypothetical protein
MESRQSPSAVSAEAEDVEGLRRKGREFLALIGRGHLADQPSTRTLPDKTIARGEDFLRICGDKARPSLTGLSLLPEGHPNREVIITYLQARCDAYFSDAEPGA